MSQTLQELVSLALAANEASTKIAAHQAAVEQSDPGDEMLADALGQLTTVADEVSSKVASSETPAERPSALDTASYSTKLASALRAASDAVKVALSTEIPNDDGGNNNGHTTSPKAPGPQGKDIPSGKGPQGELPNDGDKPPVSGEPKNTPGKVAGDRAAAERVLSAKMAEHKMLVSLGHTEAAKQAELEAKELSDKLASGPGSLDTSDGGKGGVAMNLSNETLTNMTRAQARNASVQQLGAMLKQRVAVPNDVSANVGSSHGVKVSSDSSDKEKAKLKNVATVGGAIRGGVTGGLAGELARVKNPGHKLLGHKAAPAVAAGLAGAALGAANRHLAGKGYDSLKKTKEAE